MKKIYFLFFIFIELTVFLFIIFHPSPANAAPSISSLSVSDIDNDSAKITWTTNEQATTVVSWGTTSDYSDSSSDSTLTTSHSITISGLSADTTYHYNAESVNSGGEGSDTGDQTFKTSATSSSSSTTTTTIKIITATPLPSPTPDKVPPAINIKTDFSGNFSASPLIEGSASDVSGVANLEYSFDDGKNWLPVDQINSIFGKSTSFSITLPALYDGTYKIKIKAKDGLGNSGKSKAYLLTIDRLPPRIGASLLTIGPQILSAKDTDNPMLLSGLKSKIFFSAIGGPNEIKLFAFPFGTPKSLSKPIFMTKHPESGIWSAELNLETPGYYEISATSVDGANNITEKKVTGLEILPRGIVTSANLPLKDVKITIYNLDILSNRYTHFDSDSYGLINPLFTDKNGRFGIYLPPGSFYLTIEKAGFQKIRTDIFNLHSPTAINSDFVLPELKKFRLSNFYFSLSQFFPQIVPLILKSPASAKKSESVSFIGKEFPDFVLKYKSEDLNQFALRSTPSLVTFLNTWTPSAFDQLTILERIIQNKGYQTFVIVPQEAYEEVFMFSQRGSYKVPIIADPDGDLLEKLEITSLPAHIFVDRFGLIKNIKIGLLSKEEIEKEIFNF